MLGPGLESPDAKASWSYALATPDHTQNQCVRHLPIVQIEEVRCRIVGFEHCEIFGIQMHIVFFAGEYQ